MHNRWWWSRRHLILILKLWVKWRVHLRCHIRRHCRELTILILILVWRRATLSLVVLGVFGEWRARLLGKVRRARRAQVSETVGKSGWRRAERVLRVEVVGARIAKDIVHIVSRHFQCKLAFAEVSDKRADCTDKESYQLITSAK